MVTLHTSWQIIDTYLNDDGQWAPDQGGDARVPLSKETDDRREGFKLRDKFISPAKGLTVRSICLQLAYMGSKALWGVDPAYPFCPWIAMVIQVGQVMGLCLSPDQGQLVMHAEH